MYAAISLLEKHYQSCMVMQSSPETTSYVNQITLAIKVLKDYQYKMDKLIEKELTSPSR